MQTTENLCPGILHAVPAKDGMLIRIRTPGGLISGEQLKAIAHAARELSHPTIDITARANIQLRGIQPEALPPLVQALTAAGLIPSAKHDRIRNISTSPLAGLDPDELLDTRPLVRQLDEQLTTAPSLANLPPKFSFLLDGGGRRFDSETSDLGLTAISISGTLRLHLTIGAIPTGLAVSPDRATACLLEAARACLHISKSHGISCRAKKITSTPDAFANLLHHLSQVFDRSPTPPNPRPISHPPTGILPGTPPGTVHIIPSIPLGRITAAQAEAIADSILQHEGDLRLTPWRGVVLASMPSSAIHDITHKLQAVGLRCDTSDGYDGIAACAGLTGCSSALADVRQDAATLARRLAGSTAAHAWTINLSGCDKRCAMRNGATAELVATPSGYSLKIDGDIPRSECSPEAAIDLVVSSLRSEARPESES